MYDFIFCPFYFLFQCKFYCLFQCGFYHFPSQTPLPSPTLYGYLDSGTSDIHRGGHATTSYGSLSMGKHPLLHFLTKHSQCHQPQDHESYQQILAKPNPSTPPQQQSLSSQN